ncbi:MAG: zinc ribbon domain-containing protein [Clostridia bacterium]|nr:zinc ribbon domain-containing protein [Clostridia bacterium]
MTDEKKYPDKFEGQTPPPFDPNDTQRMMCVYAGPEFWNPGPNPPAGDFAPANVEKAQDRIFCPFCGSPVKKEDRFCNECGEKLQKTPDDTDKTARI